jgi:glycosyltransferase involved in cell wall biosynthesis
MRSTATARPRPGLRVGLDLTFLAAERTGLGMYSLNLVAGLGAHGSDLSYVLFVSRAGRPYLPVLPDNFTVVTVPVPYALRFGLEQMLVPLFLQQRLHVLHSPCGVAPLFYPGRIVVTVHDLTYARAPHTMTAKSRLYFGPLLLAGARRAARVITVSSTVRAELCRHERRLSPARVVAIPEAINERFLAPRPDPVALSATLRRYNVSTPYILFVGTMEPRKNLQLVLRAFARLRSSGQIAHKLVLAGRIGWLSTSLQETIRALGVERDIMQIGYVPDEDLPALYRGADLLAFPSLYEGFGLPPIEAMACGTPVIASALPVLREVGGNAALFVDPHSVDDLCASILAVLTDPGLRAAMIRRGRAQAQRYSPAATAHATVEVYRDAVAAGA